MADMMINARYDPVRGEVPAFEELVGSHGGLGGSQSFPFALVPADWHQPSAPVVGAEATQRLMCRSLTDLGQREGRTAEEAGVNVRSDQRRQPTGHA